MNATRIKYNRTFHLPWSLGATADDKTLKSTDHFVGQEVVVTEKMDGENTTIYHDGTCHARSLSSTKHPSRDWVRAFAATVGPQLPNGWRLCGESMYAKHAIAYGELPTYFLAFGIYDENNRCLSWADTVEWCALLGVTPVPALYVGTWDEAAIRACYTGKSTYGTATQEGYVVRTTADFAYADFAKHVAKFVRAGHVAEGSDHWAHVTVIPNSLAPTA